MPQGRKLDIQTPIVVDLGMMTENLKRFNTRCETKKCHPDLSPAFMYHQSQWSFAYLCQPCWVEVASLAGQARVAWDRALAEWMYELMMRRSYVHMNIKSGFVLEEVIASREENERNLTTLADRERAREQRELRKQIRESETKVGAPDDELLVARQRQDLRKQMGVPTLGAQRVDRVSILRARLIVPSIPTQGKEEEE